MGVGGSKRATISTDQLRVELTLHAFHPCICKCVFGTLKVETGMLNS